MVAQATHNALIKIINFDLFYIEATWNEGIVNMEWLVAMSSETMGRDTFRAVALISMVMPCAPHFKRAKDFEHVLKAPPGRATLVKIDALIEVTNDNGIFCSHECA